GRRGVAPSVLGRPTRGGGGKRPGPRHFRRARGRLVILRTRDGVEHRARILAVSPSQEVTLRPEAGRDDRGRPLKLPKGTPDRLEIPVTEIETAQVQI